MTSRAVIQMGIPDHTILYYRRASTGKTLLAARDLPLNRMVLEVERYRAVQSVSSGKVKNRRFGKESLDWSII